MTAAGGPRRRRGDHYFHSSFCDLVLSGLVGIHVADPELDSSLESETRPESSHSSTLEVRPLFAADDGIGWFAATAVRVRGHEVEVLYDRDGSRWGGQPGLAVWVDGELRAHDGGLGPLRVPLLWMRH